MRARLPCDTRPMDTQLLATTKRSSAPARDAGSGQGRQLDEVVKLEVLRAAHQPAQARRAACRWMRSAKTKSRIMQRILINDAEIRHLAEPCCRSGRHAGGPQDTALKVSEHVRGHPPAQLQAEAAATVGRVPRRAPAQVLVLMRQLRDGNVPVNLNSPTAR